jgi:hypothetical protein
MSFITPTYKITQPRELLQIYPKCKKLQALEPVIDCFEIFENHPLCYSYYDDNNSPVRCFMLNFCPTCNKDVTQIKKILKLTDKHFGFKCLLFHNLFDTASWANALCNGFDREQCIQYKMFNDTKHYRSTMKFSVNDKKLGQKIEFRIFLSIPIKYYFKSKKQIVKMLTKYGEEVINDEVKRLNIKLKKLKSKIH